MDASPILSPTAQFPSAAPPTVAASGLGWRLQPPRAQPPLPPPEDGGFLPEGVMLSASQEGALRARCVCVRVCACVCV